MCFLMIIFLIGISERRAKLNMYRTSIIPIANSPLVVPSSVKVDTTILRFKIRFARKFAGKL